MRQQEAQATWFCLASSDIPLIKRTNMMDGCPTAANLPACLPVERLAPSQCGWHSRQNWVRPTTTAATIGQFCNVTRGDRPPSRRSIRTRAGGHQDYRPRSRTQPPQPSMEFGHKRADVLTGAVLTSNAEGKQDFQALAKFRSVAPLFGRCEVLVGRTAKWRDRQGAKTRRLRQMRKVCSEEPRSMSPPAARAKSQCKSRLLFAAQQFPSGLCACLGSESTHRYNEVCRSLSKKWMSVIKLASATQARADPLGQASLTTIAIRIHPISAFINVSRPQSSHASCVQKFNLRGVSQLLALFWLADSAMKPPDYRNGEGVPAMLTLGYTRSLPATKMMIGHGEHSRKNTARKFSLLIKSDTDL